MYNLLFRLKRLNWFCRKHNIYPSFINIKYHHYSIYIFNRMMIAKLTYFLCKQLTVEQVLKIR